MSFGVKTRAWNDLEREPLSKVKKLTNSDGARLETDDAVV